MQAQSSTGTVLVLGANGRLGQAAVTAFAVAGWRVLAQVRRAPAVPLPAGAELLARPLADTAGLSRAAAGAHAVVYAVNPVYTRWTEEALPLARLGMDLAQRLGACFMLPGNVYNFGQSMPVLLREDTPQRPSTEKGRQRCELEDELAARAAQSLRGVVIRAGDFFGAGTGSWLDLVIAQSLAAGKLVYPGLIGVPHAWAYLPDLARAFVAVAARPSLGGGPGLQRLHFAGHTLTGAELLAAVERAAGRLGVAPTGGFRHGHMPWRLMALAGLVWPMGRELARMAYLWRVPHALDGRALEAVAGPLPATPIDDALVDALRALGHGRAATTTTQAAMA